MTRKKGQFGLDTIMSYLVFGFFLLFTMVALTISGCGSSKKSIERGIDVDSSAIAGLRASEQLTAYLNTPIPDKATLYKRLDEAEKVGINNEYLNYYEIKNSQLMPMAFFDEGDVKSFLDEHPEVYVDKTYGEFLSALYVFKDGREYPVYDVFDGVTKALFYRPLFSKAQRDAGMRSTIYTSPVIAVQYGKQKNVYVGTLYSYVVALKILPTFDEKGISVKLAISNDEPSEPLP